MNTIDINYEIDEFQNIISQEEVTFWAEKILSELSCNNKIFSLYFTTDEIMKDLNKNYRKKDYITDVLSFPNETKDPFSDPSFLGDIAICIPQAKRQAEERKNDIISEIKFLILHGILHLSGYDHENDNGEMEKIEKDIYYKLTGEKIE